MLIIPAIDLLGGSAVRLVRGDFDSATNFGDPLLWLDRWKLAGAELVHVVDLDGARDGTVTQTALIAQMASRGGRIQVGGGIRHAKDVQALLDAGVTRVVVGTAAVDDPKLVTELAARFGEALVVAIDARDGMVATHGWAQTATILATDLARQLSATGVRRFLVTDIVRDGTLTEPNYDLLQDVMDAAGMPVIASGGVTAMETIHRLRTTGVEAAIVGRALYDGLLNFGAAMEAANAG
jgi:phosphoribosylformimino-5-aminoimidazole carboxamide ribotide isomerase